MSHPPALAARDLNAESIRAAILSLDRVQDNLTTSQASAWNAELSRYAAFAHGAGCPAQRGPKRVALTGSVIGLGLSALDLGSFLSFLGFGLGGWLFVYGLGADIEEHRQECAWLLLQEEIAAAQQRLHDAV